MVRFARFAFTFLVLALVTGQTGALAVDTSDYRFHRMPETSYYGGINSVTKDVFGRIWFSGTDALYMYNGIAFHKMAVPNPTPEVPLNYRSVRRLPDGELIVSTNVGLFGYDYKSQSFRLDVKGDVSYVEIDSEGRAWLIIDDVLSRYSPLSGPQAFPKEGFVPDACHCAADKVFVSRGGELWQLDPSSGTFSLWHSFDVESKGSFQLMDVAYADNMYYVLSGRDGLWECLPDGTQKRYTAPAGNGVAKQLHVDDKGVIWIAAQHGLELLDRETLGINLLTSDLNNPYSLPNDSVWAIYADPQGGAWIGTYGGKLAYQTFEDDDILAVNPSVGGLNHPIVSAFAEDSKGRLWVGTEGGALSCYDYKSRLFIPFKIVNPSKIDISMVKRLRCVDDKLYIASFNGGLSCLDIKTGVLSPLACVDPATHAPFAVYDFELDSDRGAWLSNPDSELLYWERASGKIEKVRAIAQDGSSLRLRVESLYYREPGRLVLATHTGVIVMDASSRHIIAHYKIEGEDINPNNLKCYCLSDDAQCWFGTMGAGVVRLSDDGKYSLLKGLDGQNPDKLRIFSMQKDPRSGDIWLSSDDGLYVYRKSDAVFEKIRIGSRILCGAYYIRSGFTTSEGHIVFGGTDGFVIFDPSKVNIDRRCPSIYFTSFRVNNEIMNPGAKNSPLSQSVETLASQYSLKKSTIRLAHSQSNFEIGFSSDNYTEGARVSYAYRMAGLSDTWTILPPGQRYVRFLNLPAGRYRFEIKAANNQGEWGEQVNTLYFHVRPSLMLSPVAWLIYLVLISLVVWFLWTWSTRRKMLEQQLSLEMEKERNLQELNQLRNEFFTNISHDLKTPLTLVIDPLHELEKQIPQDAPYRTLVSMIGRNVSRIQHMLQQLLQFRQIETVKPQVNAVPGDIVKFLDSVFSLFEFYANKKNIETEFMPWVDSYRAAFDTDMVEKAFTNLFSNAVKYAGADGYIGVRIAPSSPEEIPSQSEVSPSAQWLTFTVTNTGSEIPRSRYKTIFEPFNKAGKTRLEFESHTGLGLAIVKALVGDMNGTISVSSSDNKVSFIVVLPLVPVEAVQEENVAVSEDGIDDEAYDYASYEVDAMLNEMEPIENSDESSSRKAYDVLIIEDDPQLRSYLEQRLSRHYNVYTAADGNDGIVKAGRIMPKLIVTDLLMPDVDGFELCRAIRTDIRTSHIPIIALSATGENTNFKIEALESGANVFLDKPVDIDFLQKQIARLIKNQDNLKELYSKRFVAEPTKLAPSTVDEDLMRKAVGFIEKNFENENYGVEDFVSDMAIARTRLYQKINDLTGMSIKEFILDIRLKRASQLLRESEYTIAEISTMTGFASPKYFSICFKRHFGQSPSEFKSNPDAQ